MHGKTWALALAGVAAFALQVRAATVTATLDPLEISMGDSSQLTVTVTGAQEQPNVPNVDGLDITSVSQSSQIEIINGSMTANSSITYEVTPQHEGTFVIPAIRVGGAASQPITLRVLKGSGAAASPPAQAAPSPPATGPVVFPPQSASSPAAVDHASAPKNQFGWIQITLPKKEFYVGELVPVDIRAYIPQDIQATGIDMPQFTSDGFTLNSLSTKPGQSGEMVNGRPYTVVTWHSALTGVKTGDYPISIQMPMSVIVSQRMPQPDDDDIFSNFFRNAYAAIGTKKNVTIQSEDETLKVLPLPQANRPADFSGAVGQFEIEASATPTRVNVGDPITLRLKVTGTGNFDRVSSDLLASDSHWKTYSSKSHFDPLDSVGYEGEKTFEQPVIPNDSSVSAIPSLSFSFFDPETRQYVTRTTAPISVVVSGNSINPAPGPAAGAAVATTAPPPPPASPSPVAPELSPNKVESGAFVSTLRPVYLDPWFIAGQGLPLLALLGGLAFLRSRTRAAHPQRTRATAMQRAIRQEIDAMDAAMKNHQTDAFFIHARNALQQRLGQQWNMRPETITLADLEARLGDGIQNVRPIFEMADQASYSDLHFADADLRQWRQIILDELAEKNG
ncbi:MAG: BatD family protein [Methylacidiphilales bacterium]|nr:BatD family protein [Candidatus Methylacidiphilales bacterium]